MGVIVNPSKQMQRILEIFNHKKLGGIMNGFVISLSSFIGVVAYMVGAFCANLGEVRPSFIVDFWFPIKTIVLFLGLAGWGWIIRTEYDKIK